MDASKLREMADEADAKADEMEGAAAALREHAAAARKLADKLGSTKSSLTGKLTPVNVNKAVNAEHRFNISRGQKRRGDVKFIDALAERDYTQKTLAEKLNIAPALLSMYRRGKRPIPRDRADKVQELTGWKATLANWPGGIVS